MHEARLWLRCVGLALPVAGLQTRNERSEAEPTYGMRKVFLNSRGLRAGWRLLIFVGIFAGLTFLANWIIPKIFQSVRKRVAEHLARK